MIRFRQCFLLFLLIVTGSLHIKASEVSVTAKMDSVSILMGKLATLRLEVVENKGTTGYFTIFQKADFQKGYTTVCGDSVELRVPVVDTVELGTGKVQLNYTVPVQAFDSGTYILPKFVYISGNDSAATKQLIFDVVPVEVTAEDQISGFAPVEEPDGKRWYDFLPDWILDFWWIFIIICLAIVAFLWAFKKYGKTGITSILTKPAPTPWELALSSLKKLKERKLWEQGMEKEYFTDLTDILRDYLFQRFGINAPEMTTRQIMEKIMESDFRDKKDYVKEILNIADFVKFAKVRPLPADNILAYDNAVNFIEETIPVAPEKPDTQEKGEGEK